MTPRFVWLIGWQGMLLSGAALLSFYIGMRWYGTEGLARRHATTLSFMTMSLAQVFHPFNARLQIRSAFTVRLITNGCLWAVAGVCVLLQMATVNWPFLNAVLNTTPHAGENSAAVLACSFALMSVVELVKLGQRAFRTNVGDSPVRAAGSKQLPLCTRRAD